MAFSYPEFVTRNIGFVTEAEQEKLRRGAVFVCGVGGMGGAAVQSLARTGIGRLALADVDRFEVSNFNRQVFADLDTEGDDKAQATARRLRRINPELEIEVLGAEWLGRLDDLLARYPLVINGMDDLAAGVRLYRRARAARATVIDAYTAPLPSVTVVRPDDPRPEERLGFPTHGCGDDAIGPGMSAECLLREIEYVLVHSSSIRHVDIDAAVDLVAGRRKRMSFAPMVITTGNLMAFEALKVLLDRTPAADCRGYFLNPWTMQVERPRPWPVSAARRALVRRFLRRMTNA